MFRPFAALLLLFPLAACSRITGAEDRPPELRVDAVSFHAGDTIRAEILNHSSDEIGFGACSLALERHTPSGWMTAVPEGSLCIGILHLLLPGGVASRELAVPQDVPDGEYRLRHAFSRGQAHVEDHVHSRPFAVFGPESQHP